MKKLAVGLLATMLLGTTAYAHHIDYRGQCQQIHKTSTCQYYVDANQDGICDNCTNTPNTHCTNQNKAYVGQQNKGIVRQGHGHHGCH